MVPYLKSRRKFGLVMLCGSITEASAHQELRILKSQIERNVLEEKINLVLISDPPKLGGFVQENGNSSQS